jgi:hypothetical protein
MIDFGISIVQKVSLASFVDVAAVPLGGKS